MKCAFSGEDIEQGTGIMFVKKDGTVLHYKNRMCLRNHLGLGRVNRYTKWTRAAHELKQSKN